MSDEVLVKVENVSKKFCRNLKKSLWYGVQDITTELAGRKTDHALRSDEFWAVNDVSFELRRGECLGLLGRNGAGKSTLLRMLNGLIKPDRGSIELNGQVGGLIALGAGFNPVLTGRENVYVNGSILGLSKRQIDDRFDEIVAFSELEEFIDAPVQGYSSGMNVRLGFAVAAILLKPDVLLLDEVLAVGDIGFTIKCLNTMRQIAADSAVIFVSHSMQFVSAFCTEVLLMRHGTNLLHSNNVAEGISLYLSLCSKEEMNFKKSDLVNIGTGDGEVTDPCLLTPLGRFDHQAPKPTLYQGIPASLEFSLVNHIDSTVEINVYIVYMSMQAVISYKLKDASGKFVEISRGIAKISIDLGSLNLNAGSYSFTVIATDSITKKYLAHVGGIIPFDIQDDECEWAYIIHHPTYQISYQAS
jgi:lipopolysaccharide transport system ATP-binding protein